MTSRVEIDEDCEMRGSMWVLDQKLDQPMDEEAGRLSNMYKEKVPTGSFFLIGVTILNCQLHYSATKAVLYF